MTRRIAVGIFIKARLLASTSLKRMLSVAVRAFHAAETALAGVQFAGIISSEIPKRRHPVAFQMKGVHLGYPPLPERMTDVAPATIAFRPAFRSCLQYHVSLFLSILT